jgi:3-hydroxy-9,10-secoandrosta-1,3,5(10)-triene-9,17-dione monooxygenase
MRAAVQATAAPGTAPSAAALIEAARALAPRFAERAARCEAERRVPEENIRALIEAGLFDVVKPRRYGGHQLGWDVFNETVLPVAAACGSTGWILGVVGGHPLVATRFGIDFMDEMWGADPDALMSSCRRLTGTLRPVAGGFVGSGSGGFSSGCLHAQWVIVGNMPIEGEERLATVVLPRGEVEVLDTWQAMGLAGTGSHDIRFHERFIPDHRVTWDGKPPAGGAIEAPVYRPRHLGGPFTLCSVPLGIALGVLDDFTAITRGRSSRGVDMAAQQSMQMRIGESALELEAALALWRTALAEMMANLGGHAADARGLRTALPRAGGGPVDQALCAFVARSAYAAVERLFSAAGASQLKLSGALQRRFRDTIAAIQQPSNNWDLGRTTAGRILLTQET